MLRRIPLLAGISSRYHGLCPWGSIFYAKEDDMEMSHREAFTCHHCGAEADITLEGFESVADVIQREKKLPCKKCGKEVPWTKREDIKAVKVAMEAEMNAYQAYSKAAKKTKNPKGRDMLQHLSEFEMNHYRK